MNRVLFSTGHLHGRQSIKCLMPLIVILLSGASVMTDAQPLDAQQLYAAKRNPNPSYYPYPDVPFPKFPTTPADTGYQPGMGAEAYFKVLCEQFYGETIYRTADQVEGIYQIRPRAPEPYAASLDQYALEDPYDFVQGKSFESSMYIGKRFGRFEFFESTNLDNPQNPARFFRRSGYTGELKSGAIEYVDTLRSRYGYTWRGVEWPGMRENGIGGGEMFILDLSSNEILGFRRYFIRTGNKRNTPKGYDWQSGQMCKQDIDGRRNSASPHHSFLFRVLQPQK